MIDGPLHSKNPVELHTTPLHMTLIPRSNLPKYQRILARETSLVLAIYIRDAARSALECHNHVLADLEYIDRMSSHCPCIALIPVVASAVMLYIQRYCVDVDVVELEIAVVRAAQYALAAKAGHKHGLGLRQ